MTVEQVMIRTMGHFTIEAGGVTHEGLAAKSRKGISLMQYLMTERGKPVPTQRLIRELWTGTRNDNPENALKTMVSRLRGILNGVSAGLGECIGSGQGAYQWVSLPNVRVDVLDILSSLDALRADPTPQERARHTERILELYTGDLFQTGDINNGLSLVNWLHHEYLAAVSAYIEQLKKEEAYNKICQVCRTALQVDDLDEEIHIELMQAMVNLNRASEAMSEYKRLARQTRRYYDDEPGEEAQAAYSALAEAGKVLRFNMDVIRNELQEQEGERRGPFFCDYRAFKEIYNIQMRNLERLGSTMFLGVIMLGDSTDALSPVARESGMAGLQEILRNNLRKGDIVTRFSDNVYAMLLPTVNYNTGTMVMDRIQSLFCAENFSQGVSFHARISPLGSGM